MIADVNKIFITQNIRTQECKEKRQIDTTRTFLINMRRTKKKCDMARRQMRTGFSEALSPTRLLSEGETSLNDVLADNSIVAAILNEEFGNE